MFSEYKLYICSVNKHTNHKTIAFMRKLSLIIGSMLFALSSMANSEVNEANVSELVKPAENTLLFKDNLLSFSQSSKLVISDKNGHVIFYNENVQALDFSEWEHGSYVAQVNDSETFEFTL